MRQRLRELLSRDKDTGNGRRDDQRPALEQIDELTERNRKRPSAKLEKRLVELRNEAFAELDRRPPTSTPPEALGEVEGDRRYEVVDGLPTIAAADLDALTVRAAFLSHGALLVRGLARPERARALAEGIDKAFAGRDAHIQGTPAKKTAPWFVPFEPAPAYSSSGKEWNRLQAGGGSVWATDSPRMMFELLELFEEVGLPEMIGEYLGERPAFSMKKSVLRRVSPETGTAWHQDGAFLGEGLRTLNVWLALNRCGDESPGLDVVPQRLEEIVPTGTEGAYFDWAVSDAVVEDLTGGAPIPSPIFEPGDALLFDHLCLHRTGVRPGMEKQRYATETWCFAPSTYPDKQIPIVV
jgi:hypothetical protein